MLILRGGSSYFTSWRLFGRKSATVNISNLNTGGAYIYSETGVSINDGAMPASFGQNLNIATGGNASNKDSVIMKK